VRFVLERVRYMPKDLQSGVLYVSDEFLTAAHLCACGWGAKIRTPLGPTEWSVAEVPKDRPCCRFAEGMDPGFAKPFPPEFPC
jgi:hypothetical protein